MNTRLKEIFGRTIVSKSFPYVEEIEIVNVYEGGADTTTFSGKKGYHVEVELVSSILHYF
jgi:hypothetical protein